MLHREVDLGPFKHKIDDGLELRKAAFECMDVLLDRCKDCINMADFIMHLEKGLQVSNFVSGLGIPAQHHEHALGNILSSIACLGKILQRSAFSV